MQIHSRKRTLSTKVLTIDVHPSEKNNSYREFEQKLVEFAMRAANETPSSLFGHRVRPVSATRYLVELYTD